jgi:excisionase family DNA binding protein
MSHAKRKAVGPPREEQRAPLILTIRQAAKRLNITEERAYTAAKAGHIPTIPMGGRMVVPVAALERMLAEGTRTEVPLVPWRGGKGKGKAQPATSTQPAGTEGG